MTRKRKQLQDRKGRIFVKSGKTITDKLTLAGWS